MRRFLKLFLVLACLSYFVEVLAQPSAQKPKRIYITLDVSESMAGNKYVMANYAAQIISVFAGEDDAVTLYYFGKSQDLSSILKPFENLDNLKKRTYNEISDLTQFLKDYRPNPRYEDWLFIIGDGDWSMQKGRYDSKTEFDATWAKIEGSPWFGDGRLNVCYLQTSDRIDDTTIFTEKLTTLQATPGHPSIDIRKSDDSAESVLENCLYFANRILGFSVESITIGQAGSKCVTFTSEFPLDRFVLMYQSVAEGKLDIASVSIGGQSIPGENILLKGNPSTEPLIKKKGPLLNGAVWEVDYPQGIPAGEQIQVCFTQDVSAADLTLYPYVDVLLQMRPFTEAGDTLLVAGPGLFKMSDTEERVLVKLGATDKHGNKFPPPLMQKMDVKLSVDGSEVPVTFSPGDTTFQVLLEMPKDTLSYFSTVESPGYFRRITPNQTVLKSADLRPPEQVPIITLSEQTWNPVTFEFLRNGNSFGGEVSDPLFNELIPFAEFDVQEVEELDHYPYAGGVGFTLNPDGTLSFTHTPDSDWCECAFPESLHYMVTLRSSQGVLHDGKLYEGFRIPVTVPIEKRGWWMRCRNYIILLIGLLVLFIYILMLKRKRRFGKDSAVKAVYYNRFQEEVDNGYQIPLRDSKLRAWLARWFWPANEKRSLYFVSPDVNMSFTAGDSYTSVNALTEGLDDHFIIFDSLDHEEGEAFPKKVTLTDGSTVTVMKNERNREGYLQYLSGEKEGGDFARVFYFLMLLAIFAAECLVLWTLFQSLSLF